MDPGVSTKFQITNIKQIQITQSRNSKRRSRWFKSFVFWGFGFVCDLMLEIWTFSFTPALILLPDERGLRVVRTNPCALLYCCFPS